jgi:hypothetical protein
MTVLLYVIGIALSSLTVPGSWKSGGRPSRYAKAGSFGAIEAANA